MSTKSFKKAVQSCITSPETMALISSLVTLWVLTSVIYTNETVAVSADAIISILVGFFVFKLIKLQQMYAKIEYNRATKDLLTNIYNKTYLYDIGKREIKACLRSQYSLSMVIFRIDGYEGIFTKYGQRLAEQSLVTLTHNIKHKTRQGDVFARLRDNEFVVLCPDATVETTSELARRIQLLTDSLVCTYAPDKSIDFTCSVIITQYSPELDREFGDMVARVEKELDETTETNQLIIT